MRPCFSDVNFTPVSLGGFLATDISGQDVFVVSNPCFLFSRVSAAFLVL